MVVPSDLAPAVRELIARRTSPCRSTSGAKMQINKSTRHQKVIGQFGGQVPDEECKAMKGLIEEGSDIIEADGDPVARDTALIAAAQRVEHYEIAAYGTARTLAQQLELPDAASLLEQTLEEERKDDGLLNKIATGGMLGTGLNEKAAR